MNKWFELLSKLHLGSLCLIREVFKNEFLYSVYCYQNSVMFTKEYYSSVINLVIYTCVDYTFYLILYNLNKWTIIVNIFNQAYTVKCN